jgi:hypothetical protein
VGTRVRITFDARPTITGTVMALDADSIVVRGDDSYVSRASRREVRQLETSRGVRGHALAGAMVGFAAGAAVGVAVGSGEPTRQSGFFTDRASHEVIDGCVGALAGVLLGGTIGQLYRTERWATLDIRTLGRFDLVPSTHGAAIVIALRF